ncbi:hypothetical protein KC734_13305 [candidate division KSB1 bacterium]|nr:hypothetical protein [candidate division KSB1 bacterium]
MNRNHLILLIGIMAVSLSACSKEMPEPAYSNNASTINLPDKSPVFLTTSGEIRFEPISEASGLVQSRLWPDVLWTHNDSGDEARIFPIHRDGSIIKPVWMKNYEGIRIPDAVNVDWEDIAADDKGNLIIADMGNNSNARRDLAVYFVSEPYPNETVVTSARLKVQVFYPDQKTFPAEKRNYDCEGMFWARGKLYFLTKHRSDKTTKLYRLDKLDPLEPVPLTLVSQFNIQGMVTGADARRDGKEIAVLAYNAVWLFEAPNGSDDYFAGKIRWLPIKDERKFEAICYDEDDLLVACEEREICKVPMEEFVILRE